MIAAHRLFEHYDFARPSVAQRAARDLSQGSSRRQPRGQDRRLAPAASVSRWLRCMAASSLSWWRSQRDPLSWSGLGPHAASTDQDIPSMRDALDGLARVNRAVHADLLVADRSRSRGELRDP